MGEEEEEEVEVEEEYEDCVVLNRNLRPVDPLAIGVETLPCLDNTGTFIQQAMWKKV